ncbi:MAG: acyl-CoA dehydratase activase [bacterium]
MNNFFMGVDIGSRTGKAIILDRKGKIVDKCITDTSDTTEKTFQNLINSFPISIRSSITYSVGTGYGRTALENSVDKTLTEISCHFRGAGLLFSSFGTVIDMGGQDSKLIISDEKGDIHNFIMNDRCAAGTGRFLEIMCDRLGFSIEEFAEMDISGIPVLPINSTCTVFAESEVVSLLASDTDRNIVASSIALMSARNMYNMFRKVAGVPPVCMTGGVSRINPVKKHLEKLIGEVIITHETGQYAGALGAALTALSTGENHV